MKPIAILGRGKPTTYGPELAPATTAANYPLFSASTTVADVAGKLRVTAGGSSTGKASSAVAITTIAGQTYKISGNMTPGTATNVMAAGTTRGGTNIFQTGVLPSGPWTRTFVATGTAVFISPTLNTFTSGIFADFDSISVKQVL